MAERCQFRAFDPPPARKELVGDDWVVHFGEHSIVHDLYHGGGTSGAPIHLVFFGVISFNDAGTIVKNHIANSGWQVPPGACEGTEKKTHLYDFRHGGADVFVDNKPPPPKG